ncbi:AbrB/MazE/SpoVT family DNA-binding domain-containing protein [Candidatus Woesearchaeota archaeon]|nr:AbrB/MazE/SpoVT family DNA-binding domain-containing protein [Candidatus Woesearchaeota archaeon]
MVETEVKTRKWGSSIGVVLPKEIVDEVGIKPDETIRIDVRKPVKVKDVFGMFPEWKRPTQEIKDEARAGWMSDSDLEEEKSRK